MTSIFEQVKAALAPRLPEVLAELLPGGRVSGREYVCASLQGGAGTSCATNLETGKGSDFATGESWGDVIALAAKIWNMRQGEAAQELARLYHIDAGQNTPQPLRLSATFSVILPVPEAAPQPPRCHAQHGQASVLWRYADAQGRTLGHVARFETPEGKVILPLCFGQYGTGRPQWIWKALPEPRPLYGLPGLQRTDSPVLLVEGEKTADAAQKLFPHCVVLTWSGGANAVGKADWSPLAGRAVIYGNSSKARKGTSRHPVTKLFARDHCQPADLKGWDVALPARESGGPLSTGEGLGHHVRDESDEERERHQRQNPNEPIREKGDKRLIILDEEFASGLACTKREGNTLSMGIRCFWDSGDYAPLTKNNPVTMRAAHISILTHITMQELAVCLGEMQAVNGFGNRFLWICARRAKLVPLPTRMPDAELAPLQRELWRLVGLAQQRGTMTMTQPAVALWESLYTELSQEHSGLAGSIINRAEAQTLRLALIYALLDGAERIAENHLQAALAMWSYAQESVLYIFGDRVTDPLEEKVLAALKAGPLTATELSAALNRHVPRERLQPLLQQLEGQQRISILKQKNAGRPRLIIALRVISEESEKGEFSEKREAHP